MITVSTVLLSLVDVGDCLMCTHFLISRVFDGNALTFLPDGLFDALSGLSFLFGQRRVICGLAVRD